MLISQNDAATWLSYFYSLYIDSYRTLGPLVGSAIEIMIPFGLVFLVVKFIFIVYGNIKNRNPSSAIAALIATLSWSVVITIVDWSLSGLIRNILHDRHSENSPFIAYHAISFLYNIFLVSTLVAPASTALGLILCVGYLFGWKLSTANSIYVCVACSMIINFIWIVIMNE